MIGSIDQAYNLLLFLLVYCTLILNIPEIKFCGSNTTNHHCLFLRNVVFHCNLLGCDFVTVRCRYGSDCIVAPAVLNRHPFKMSIQLNFVLLFFLIYAYTVSKLSKIVTSLRLYVIDELV
jgi:hypothetical protein